MLNWLMSDENLAKIEENNLVHFMVSNWVLKVIKNDSMASI